MNVPNYEIQCFIFFDVHDLLSRAREGCGVVLNGIESTEHNVEDENVEDQLTGKLADDHRKAARDLGW